MFNQLNNQMIFTTYIPEYKSITRKEISDLKQEKNSELPIIIKNIFPFGKYKGQLVKQVINKDIQYVLWFVDNMNVTMSSSTFNNLITKMRSSPAINSFKKHKVKRLKFIGRRLKY